jgi:hypothetical protein
MKLYGTIASGWSVLEVAGSAGVRSIQILSMHMGLGVRIIRSAAG